MKYTIRITTKGAVNVMQGMIEFAEGANVEEVLDCITTDDVDSWEFEPHDGLESGIYPEYIAAQCIGDEYEGRFELEVLDEEENVILTSDNVYDVKMVSSIDFLNEIENYYEDENERPDEELLQRMHKVMLEKLEEDKRYIYEGYCILVVDEMKWQEMYFEVEDDEFDINKLLFLQNPQLEGAGYDYYTDSNHVMYGDQILENLTGDEGDDYGMRYFIAKRHKQYFEIIRELD